ncbi:aspartate aminotransferase family protein [Prosthecomicrobium hirschii]|uniref:Omega amino acid--pyruvate aminotransferase n=1 Tax=Prosthecodimorpha hirschii TaxID=665126 RepID=A0A0P6VWV7_9HYPH|nr:aspartate aminotransferase family protein [Prosthecomicrobium hirschii]KPL55837.1 omega amino acid--pyruvate aminotransferase [Prosthecomicrobium hirschii]MCW1841698.1 aspartate aminotransferase family protein [Prosthecomicrobium hirschii]
MNYQHRTNDLEAFWMPFSANRQFKKAPRMLVSADRMHYRTDDGRSVLDGTAGLWCCNAGHNRPKIVEAIRAQAGELDYAPAFQMGHPKVFEFASKVVNIAPEGFDHVFFTNSGSESVETALKMAVAYHRVKGNGSKFRLIGRERGYHGVNFGGISVGGIVSNRKMFGTLLTGVDHIRHTHDLARNAFTRGEPEHGADLADDLERLVTLHDASTIAAVIVEPVAGSTGVLIPPKGYLQRLRAICDKHDILLIFDEVITGFGRLGTPFATDYFGVSPDIIVTAKGITNGVIPMGGVFVKSKIHDAFMNGPEHLIEFFHGYTYSGNPIACAAGLGTLETYKEDGLLTRGAELAPYWEDALQSLKGLPHVIDVRNIGLIGAIELESIPGEPTKRAFSCFLDAFERGILIRTTGDIIALSPPLIISKAEIDQLIGTLAQVLKDSI